MARTIDTSPIGDTASLSKTVTEGDAALFAGISGDFNSAY